MKLYSQIIVNRRFFKFGFLTKSSLFLFLILQLVVCPLRGQALQKKHVQIHDYPLWSDMRLTNVSQDGKWVSCLLDYDGKNDTLTVRSTTSDKAYNFVGITHYEFIKNEHFVFVNKGNLEILGLKDGTSKNVSNVKNYAYSRETDQLVVLADDGKNSVLSIINSKHNIVKKIESITYFKMSPDGRIIVYISRSKTGSNLVILDLKTEFPTKVVIENSSEYWDNFTWQKSKALSFFRRENQDSPASLSYYNMEKKSLSVLNPAAQNSFPKDKLIAVDFRYPMSISDNLESVFFCIKPTAKEKKSQIKAEPEIWYTNAKQIYSRQQRTEPLNEKPNLAVWFPSTGTFDLISSQDFPDVLLAGDKKYALLSDPLHHEPALEYDAPQDFYIKNLKTGKQEMLVKKIVDYRRNLLPSPYGKYIAYFIDNNWWIYDIETRKHKNLTEKIDTEFSGIIASMTIKYPYGNPGWSDDDKEIFLYDQYDIWAVKPNGDFRRLTSGREKKIQFRFAFNLGGNFRLENYDGCKSSTIDIHQEVILDAVGSDAKTGYFKWNEKNKEQPIVYENAFINEMHFIKKTNSYIYQKQDFNKSPFLIYQTADKTPVVFFESNKHQSGFFWGHSEHVNYQNAKRSTLRAGLYYPADYNPEKKYPMIVHIYEKQSQEIHKYTRPTLFEGAGFNSTVLSLEGYFVLCPDIEYEIGKIGESAVDCVTAAVAAVIDKGLVNPDQIGLMGHSFGGYETAFIAGKSDMFTTAVAGAAPIDLNSFYYSINWHTGKAHMTKFNVGQFRLGTSPFNEPLTYLNNSPLTKVSNIKMPLLFWSGKDDQQVDWHQSIEFFTAMHSLQKNNVMLLYNEEEHSIIKPANQKDLSIRILDWFDYFLKSKKQSEWIEKRMQ